MFLTFITGQRKLYLINAVTIFVFLIISQGFFVSLFYETLDSSTVTAIIQIFLSLLIFLFFASLDRDSIEYFRRTIGMVGILVAFIAIYQIVARPFGLPYSYFEITNQQIGSILGFQRTIAYGGGGVFEFLRVSSTFAEPGDLAKFMLLCLAINYSAIKRNYGFWYQGLPSLTVILSQSIGGYFIITVLYFLFFNFKKMILYISLTFAFILLTFYFNDGLSILLNRFLSIYSGSVFLESVRFNSIGETIDLILPFLILGAGIGSADQIFENIVVANFWLNYTGEFGIVGVTLFLLLFGYIALKNSNLMQSWLKIWLLVEFIALFWKPGLLYASTIFAVFGLVYAIKRLKVNKKVWKNYPNIEDSQ